MIEQFLQTAMNRALRLDPDSAQRFGELQGKVILLELAAEREPLRIYVLPTSDGIVLQRDYSGVPDVTISGSAGIFFSQLFRGPTVSDALTIRGDIELGQRFQRAISRFSPDWEEGLARIMGDVPAHQLARAFRGFLGWGKAALHTVGRDGAEYLQEEAFVLAKRERVKEFLRAVDELRADVDRFEHRLKNLVRTR